jgi:hypothetical protein
VTRSEALSWGRGDTRRLSVRDYPAAVLALVRERLRGWACVDCVALGLTPPDDEPLEVDHLRPLARRGDNHHLNLTVRCRSHNRARGAGSANAEPRRPKWERRRAKA